MILTDDGMLEKTNPDAAAAVAADVLSPMTASRFTFFCYECMAVQLAVLIRRRLKEGSKVCQQPDR
jgi:hypothetical protein